MSATSGLRASVVVQEVEPPDEGHVADFYAALSSESRTLRFLGSAPYPAASMAHGFCSADHEHRAGFVAVLHDPEDGLGQVVGHLCVEPLNSTTAEFGLAVADRLRGRGIGRCL